MPLARHPTWCQGHWFAAHASVSLVLLFVQAQEPPTHPCPLPPPHAGPTPPPPPPPPAAGLGGWPFLDFLDPEEADGDGQQQRDAEWLVSGW